MKKFEKMSAWEFAIFFLMAICAGAIIGIGGASSLLANALLGIEGRIFGGVALPCITLVKERALKDKQKGA